MPNKLKILFISPYLPAIDTSACAKKIYDHIAGLKEKGQAVYLVSFCSIQDKDRASFIGQHCAGLYLEYLKDYRSYPYKSPSFGRKIKILCKAHNINIIQCERSYMFRYVPRDVKTPSVLTEHEILSVSFSEGVKIASSLAAKLILYLRVIKKRLEEPRWYRRADKVIVFSESDKNSIYKLYKINNVEVIPLGINLKDYPAPAVVEKKYDLAFVGNFSHLPNVDAIIYFCNKIFPLIKQKAQGVSLIIAGANPPISVKDLAKLDKNIIVTGYVRDIKEVYSKAKVFIAPIRYGTGARFKILEALALGGRVVSSSIGARGIQPGAIKIADTEEGFSEAVISLLKNTHEADGLASARVTIGQYYNWDLLLDRYEKTYQQLLGH